MHIELINTGSELLLGQTQNTHQTWIAKQLSEAGYLLRHQCTVPDTGPAIQGALREALKRADLVITTGGLGPTSDDRTRDFLSELIQRPLVKSEPIVDHIRHYFESRGKVMPDQVTIQAMIPEGAECLVNQFGTAPGLLVPLDINPFRESKKPAWIAMFPGPPRELHPMFRDQFVPWIQQELPREQPYYCRILRTSGLGESWIEERLASKLQPLIDMGLDVGYCARSGEVDIRFTAEGSNAESLIHRSSEITYQDLGTRIYGESETSLEAALVDACKKTKSTLALAESCTGGCITHRITNVPGASDVLHGSMISYANKAKIDWLGVPASSIETHGAVSEPVVREMVAGVLKESGADLALAVSGIAGPSGGTQEKPVGTAFIAVANSAGVHVVRKLNPYDRETFKFVTSNQSLEMLRRMALGLPVKDDL
ncbi:MAG: CinA family nicotinamide mononucleotide deamidase-related protein [Verrucomicrobia bacterium]|jgi:nicotinamide-nucleotide amidase|nr:CinA family nicotinamide mononucleotide deamidase-related protein [Verrucomicrobiota bacterium]